MLEPLISGQAARRADLLARLGEVDSAAAEPCLGLYANADLGTLMLALRAQKLVFDTGAVSSELRLRLDAAGVVTDCVFDDPP